MTDIRCEPIKRPAKPGDILAIRPGKSDQAILRAGAETLAALSKESDAFRDGDYFVLEGASLPVDRTATSFIVRRGTQDYRLVRRPMQVGDRLIVETEDGLDDHLTALVPTNSAIKRLASEDKRIRDGRYFILEPLHAGEPDPKSANERLERMTQLRDMEARIDQLQVLLRGVKSPYCSGVTLKTSLDTTDFRLDHQGTNDPVLVSPNRFAAYIEDEIHAMREASERLLATLISD